MMEQKNNNEQNADGNSSSQPIAKPHVTSRFSSHKSIDKGYITSLVPQDFFDRYKQLNILLSSLQKSVTDLEKVGVTVKCDFEFDAFDKYVSNIIEAYTLK